MRIEEIRSLRLEGCYDIHYFGYGSLCNEKFPCDHCRKILKKNKTSVKTW